VGGFAFAGAASPDPPPDGGGKQDILIVKEPPPGQRKTPVALEADRGSGTSFPSEGLWYFKAFLGVMRETYVTKIACSGA
jgi:hypothetical protein